MDLIRGHQHAPAWSGAAVAIGNFDGVHAGHRALLQRAREHGARAGFTVDVIAPVEVGGEVASSTHVRAHLRAGDLAAAERLLGRRWDVDGVVVHGAKRGRAIGVPTANIAPDSDLPLRAGIYAVTLGVGPV